MPYCCCPAEDAQNHDLAAIPEIQQCSVLDPPDEAKLVEKAIRAESLKAPEEAPALKAELVKEKEEPRAAPAAPAFGTFSVAIPVTDHTALGLRLEGACELGPIIQEVKPGAVASFNEQHPGEALQVFDMITSINDVKVGTSANVDDIFRKTAEKGGSLTLQIQRPKKIQLLLCKTESLGLKLEFASRTLGAIVQEVGKGLVPSWNAENSEDAVGKYDRVIEVNNVQHDGDDLMNAIQQLEKDSQFFLTVLKFPGSP